jgi:eukaryotic-like serine/threonine-protein kinase
MRALRTSDERTVGRYRMIAELGSGGMGRVLLGSASDGRLVALKQVRAQFVEDDGFRARFRHEVTASCKVSGAYTAAVIDADPEAPVPWLASVFVPGPSLREVVETVGVLPVEATMRLAAGLASALIEIHRADLVHRDLTPSNVLLTDDGSRVIDFGIARATDSAGTTELTRPGWVVGAPGFMSPEQAEGRPVSPASDVFSLGTVLYLACTGSGPFAGTSTPNTLHNVVYAEPELSTLPPELRRIIEPCLAKAPHERPTPTQLVASIGQLAPVARPWPAGVHQLIAEQRAAVDELLDAAKEQGPGTQLHMETNTGPQAGDSRTGAGHTELTRVATSVARIVAAGGNRVAARTRVVTAVVRGGFESAATMTLTRARPALATLRAHLPLLARRLQRGLTALATNSSAVLTVLRDILLVLAGVAAGIFVSADANHGQAITLHDLTYPYQTAHFPIISDALTHASYAGGLAGAALGALAGGMVCVIGTAYPRLIGRLVLAMAVSGFMLGWLAEHGHMNIAVLSVGSSGLVGLRVGLALGLAPLLLLLRIKEHGAGIVLPVLMLTGLTAAVGCACGYFGLIGIVLGGSVKVELATVVGAAVGCGVALRIRHALHARTTPAKSRR